MSKHDSHFPIARSLCAGKNKTGKDCPWKAKYGGYCFKHAIILTGGAFPSQTAR